MMPLVVSSHRCSLYLYLEMASRVLVLLVVIQVACGDEPYRAGNEGLMDKLSNGMKIAKDFLASESVALKVAEFVVRAFQTTNKPATPVQDDYTNRRNPYSPTNDDGYNEEPLENERPYESKPNYNVHETANPLTPLKQLVKLFGLQPTQISAVAVNALLFVAQMISTFLSGPQRPGRPNRADDPLTWVLNKPSSRLQDLLTTAKNESLPDIIEDLIQQQGSSEDISCVRLLICKITPFVSKMQKAVFGKMENDEVKERGAGASIMYRHLPSEGEINERSGVCEQRYKECNLE